jgi:predicted outer membrane protein
MFAFAMALGLAGLLGAQQAAPARPAAAAPAADVKMATADEQLAAVMLAGCRNEIELAIFAKPLLQSQAAKDFADKLMQDHQATCDKLEKIAGGHARPARVATTPPAEQKAKFEIGKLKLEASTIRPRAEGEAARPAAGLNWVSIHEEIADECLANAKAELQRNEKQVDKVFVGQQISKHMAMAAQLKVFEKYASSGLRNVIEGERETVAEHLKQAEQMHAAGKDAKE